MNRKRKREKFYTTLRPINIKYTQDTIADTMHIENSEGYVTKMPLGEVVDAVLSGEMNIDAIPKISVFCLRNTWYSLDNRRLWVFKKIQFLYDHTKEKYFNITCLQKDLDFVNMSKVTTSNSGEDIFVRRDPGGTKWKKMEASINNNVRNMNRLTGIRRTITNNNSNMYGPGPLCSLPPHVAISLHPSGPPRHVHHTPVRTPYFVDTYFSDPSRESYFHGEEYVPEENEEDLYWREADRYYNSSCMDDGNVLFSSERVVTISSEPQRRTRMRGRRRTYDDEEEEDGTLGWLYRDY